jgi:hypothetical protein
MVVLKPGPPLVMLETTAFLVPRWRDVSGWVLAKSKDYNFIAENVAFHWLVVDMKTELKLEY